MGPPFLYIYDWMASHTINIIIVVYIRHSDDNVLWDALDRDINMNRDGSGGGFIDWVE